MVPIYSPGQAKPRPLSLCAYDAMAPLGPARRPARLCHHPSTGPQGSTIPTVEGCDAPALMVCAVGQWGYSGFKIAFVMLNPSTATEVQNDPTVERCERRARALGYGAFRVTNIFAWRDTDPKAMRTVADPVGPENDAAIAGAAHWADTVIAAWGAHGEHLDRGRAVESLLRATGQPLFHLGLTKAGHPRHPLYIRYSVQPSPWGF